MDLLNFEEEEAAAYGKGCRPYESAHPCLHARQNPLCESGKIDYLRFYFCSNEIEDLIQPGMKAPVLIAWAIILFSTIAIVADCFFAPAIRTIAKMFKLPDDVAGATLLALGGSAPDIFTQLAAMLVSEKPDFNLAMSESVGAGIYVCSICKALAVVFSPGGEGVVVEAVPYLRDCIHYCLLLVISYMMCTYGEISFMFGFLYLAVYSSYVCFVIYGRHWVDDLIPMSWKGVGQSGHHQHNLKTVKSHVLESDDDDDDSNMIEMADKGQGNGGVVHDDNHGHGDGNHVDLHKMYEISDDDSDSNEEEEDEDDTSLPSPMASPNSSLGGKARNIHNLGGSSIRFAPYAQLPVGAAIAARHSNSRRSNGFSEKISSIISSFRKWLSMQSGAKKWSNDPQMWLTGWIVVIVSLTMPSTSRGRVRPFHAAVIAFAAPLFLLYATGMLDIVLFGFDGTARSLIERKSNKNVSIGQHGELQTYAYAIFAICLFWAKLAHSRTPARGTDPKTSPIMLACSFVVGIAWMHILADEIVFMFQALGHIFGIRESLLGGTLMAWGASAGDLAGMLAVARMGHAKMAVTASLASPGTQLAVGSGISIIIVRLRGIKVPIDFTRPMKMLMRYGIAITAYYIIFVPIVHKFSFKKKQGTSIAITYAVFVILFVIAALKSGGD